MSACSIDLSEERLQRARHGVAAVMQIADSGDRARGSWLCRHIPPDEEEQDVYRQERRAVFEDAGRRSVELLVERSDGFFEHSPMCRTTARLRSCCMRIRVSSSPRRCCSTAWLFRVHRLDGRRGPPERLFLLGFHGFDSNPRAMPDCKASSWYRCAIPRCEIRDPGSAVGPGPIRSDSDPGSRERDPRTYNGSYMSILPMGCPTEGRAAGVPAGGFATACEVGASVVARERNLRPRRLRITAEARHVEERMTSGRRSWSWATA